MERNQPPLPQKSNSSSTSLSNRDEKLCSIDRKLSLGPIHFEDKPIKKDKADTIDEGGQEKNCNDHEKTSASAPAATPEIMQSKDLLYITEDIDCFLSVVHRRANENEKNDAGPRPEIPESTIERFVELVEIEIGKHESEEKILTAENHNDIEPSFLDAVDRILKLTDTLSPFASSDPKYFDAMNLTGCVLHHAMSLLEDEFYSLMEEFSRSNKNHGSGSSGGGKGKRLSSSISHASQDYDRFVSSPSADSTPTDYHPSAETLTRFSAIAKSMISAGYKVECRQVFLICRRSAFRASMSDLGFEKMAMDDVRLGYVGEGDG